ncbi:MAG: potassium transporter TrkG [bacterium]|nr:potassium transporter TrkG [bacterium]
MKIRFPVLFDNIRDKLFTLLRKITPYQWLVFGYMFITLFGAWVLSLPVSSVRGTAQPFLDSLFISTSGISTSGLTVVDIGSYYSLFGQVTLLIIFQIGGVGYMSFIVLFMYLLGVRIPLPARIVAKESLAGSSMYFFKKFFLLVLGYTFFFEGVGACILALYWIKDYSFLRSVYLGIFHSISTFCTAGFSVFPDSLMKYRSSSLVNFTVIIISLFGGLGFFVLRDLTICLVNKIKKQFPARLSLHSRIVLVVTVSVILISTIVIFFSEKWPQTMSLYQKWLTSIFQTVSASTTDGFNTIDIGKMSSAGLTILMFLMFVGASPGSTGGGIKTTTLAILVILFWTKIRDRKNNVFKREIPDKSVTNAVIVFISFILIIFVDIIILSITENATYTQSLFEICSALGNTGLSTGITFNLSKIGKIVLIITMFIGRVGPLSIAYTLISKPKNHDYSYPKEDIFVG